MWEMKQKVVARPKSKWKMCNKIFSSETSFSRNPALKIRHYQVHRNITPHAEKYCTKFLSSELHFQGNALWTFVSLKKEKRKKIDRNTRVLHKKTQFPRKRKKKEKKKKNLVPRFPLVKLGYLCLQNAYSVRKTRARDPVVVQSRFSCNFKAVAGVANTCCHPQCVGGKRSQ